MKQKTIATRHLRTKIAAGYVLILFVIFGIVYIWLNEQHRRQELEITSQKIRCLRKDIHEVYVKWWIYPLLVRPCWTGMRKI